MKTKHAYITLALLLGCSTTAFAQVGNCTSPIGEAFLDVNNVRARVLNNGGLFWRGSPNIYTVPKNGDANAIFTGAIMVGGLIKGDLRSAAARYSRHEFWTGPLDEAGNPPNDCSTFDRIWKVDKRDVAQFENDGTVTVDLAEWPTGLGAPTLNADGTTLDITNQPLSQRIGRVIDLAAGERPDFTGDQMLWWIMNDRGNAHIESETDPIGLEVHATAFAFDSDAPPGADATFYRYRIINRNTSPLEDTYFGLFLDPDLGNFDDDYIGSDSTLNLAFTYNADNDDEGRVGYGIAPPALGTSFVRGAVAPMDGDSAIVGADWQTGFTDLGLTSFMFYHGGGGVAGDPDNGQDYYYYMQARWKDGRRVLVGGDGFESNTTSTPTNFMYSGDPVTREYWSEINIDTRGTVNHAADRRYIAATGPVDMAPGDEQEILIAIPWARGDDYLDSITKLREAARAVQRFSDRNFDSSFDTIASPLATGTARDQSAHLQWTNSVDSNNYQNSYKQLVPFADDEYVFQGYRVLQFESIDDTVGRLIATYDIVDGVTKIIEGPRGEVNSLTADGSDSGVRQYHFVDSLTNYQTYYFGVQAYATKSDFYPRVLLGETARVEIVPQKSNYIAADTSLTLFEDGSQLIGARTRGIGDTRVTARVIDPYAIRGDFYEVRFKSKTCDNGPCIGYEVTRDDEVVASQDSTGEDAFIVDGLSISVLPTSGGYGDFLTVQNGAGAIDPPEYAAYSINENGFPHPTTDGLPSAGIQQSTSSQVWGINGGGSLGHFGPIADSRSFLGRTTRSGNNLENLGVSDYEMRFTSDGGVGWKAFGNGMVFDIPFELWRTGVGTPDDPVDDVRIIPIICEVACAAGIDEKVFDLGGDHLVSEGADDPHTDWVYFYGPIDDSPGAGGYDAFVAGNWDQADAEIMARMVLVAVDAGEAPPYAQSLPEEGTVFRIVTNKPPTDGDVFRIETSSLKAREKTVAEQRTELDDIGIVPNPYRLASGYERSLSAGEVRFTNVPTGSVVNIFAINGTKVRVLNHDFDGVLTWDLRNSAGRDIASGIYLVHVDVPGVGSRVLKFGVTQRTVVN